ncbi:3-isopropylmalate dehydratase large subunit [Chloroflexota bacterium]
MKATLAQKILARASGKAEVKPGEYVMANIDLTMVHFAMRMVYPLLDEAGIKEVWDPDKVVCIFDHVVPAPTVRDAEMYKAIRDAVKRFKIKNFYGERAGICHQVLVEKGHVLPGQLIVGTDSHTTTYGALGAAAAGIGSSEMAYVMATGKLWFKVPETIKFRISGSLKPMVTSKDIIMYIAGKYETTVAQYKAIEFSGPVAGELSIASRMAMSNMAAELGAKFAFFEPDEKVKDYLAGRTDSSFPMLKADRDATYEKVYDVEISSLEPQIAMPFAVDNVKPVTQIGEVKIDQAVLGSCTNSRLEDLRIAAEIVRGKKIHPDVRFLVIPASAEVYKDAMNEGILSTLIDAGAIICNPGCGPCYGGHQGLLASGEVCVASINRNYKGRMGSPEAKVYLASPAVVAASAVNGRITDPRDY